LLTGWNVELLLDSNIEASHQNRCNALIDTGALITGLTNQEAATDGISWGNRWDFMGFFIGLSHGFDTDLVWIYRDLTGFNAFMMDCRHLLFCIYDPFVTLTSQLIGWQMNCKVLL
jgi:hypothetical protein